ncbi:MAG: hypothetical protein MUF18_06035 [Fimbriiglobus sp.]|jgi:hypothetical protein|nr:hypothetical protein [Fimbriiglobus sp.]
MRKLLFGLFALTLALGTAVAQEKKEEPKKEEKKPDAPAPAAAVTSDFFPLTKGSKWTYTMGSAEVVVEVTAVEKDGAAKLETKHAGKTVASETIQVKADGVYRTKVNDTPIDGGVKILGLKDGKPTKGDKWDVAAKVAAAEIKGSFETKDAGKAEKIGGKDYTDVAYVEGPKFTIAGTDTAVKYWFAPKFGVIKLAYTISGTESTPLELKSFEAGK